MKHDLLNILAEYDRLGIREQIDYDKFYLYSIITHSTAIEGSTVTEIEAQLLFDEGITSNKRSLVEQMMNLDLKNAYEYGIKWIKKHPKITVDSLIALSAKVMANTGSEYHTLMGDFSAAKGELRKVNVTAGFGGTSYMSCLKVPSHLKAFCTELNKRRADIDSTNVIAVYALSFWAHFQLVTIHPWADGNGRTSRLLMNLIQWEFDALPSKVLKEDKSEYIQALVDAREKDDSNIFTDCMMRLHAQHLQADIVRYRASTSGEMADKQAIKDNLIRKWSIKPSLAEKLADILCFMTDKEIATTEIIIQHFGFTDTTAKRYMRQLTEFGYLEAQGANKNRTYKLKHN